MWGFLKDQGLYPLADFFRSDAPVELFEKHKVSRERAYIDPVTHMPEDDDTNYTVTGLAIMKQHGPGFTPEDVANFWLQNIPIFHTFTADARSLSPIHQPDPTARISDLPQPLSRIDQQASFALISGVMPRWATRSLRPQYAWRDACKISHIKNGIYGEMWVAAMVAVAPYVSDRAGRSTSA